ncbi:type IV pili methyl-accepting chemotaxis transducer N-terminal domain-containing protein [Enterovibrio sp. Hal110]
MMDPNLKISVKRSVTTTVARSLIAILLLAVIITGFSIITLASSLNDAAAINTSGSLRMQSYRIAYDISVDSLAFGPTLARSKTRCYRRNSSF